MDPKYEEDIDLIISEMGDKEFTARDVMLTLKRMHPDASGKTRGTIPDTRKVSEYLRTHPLVVKTGRNHVNHYRYVGLEEEPEQIEKPPEPPPGAMSPEEMQSAIKKMDECPHPDGWKYQEAVEVCLHCNAVRPIEEKDPEVLKELKREYALNAFKRMNNVELCQAYNWHMRSSDLRDKGAKGGKDAALHDTILAEGCAEILAAHARRQRKNIRRT